MGQRVTAMDEALQQVQGTTTLSSNITLPNNFVGTLMLSAALCVSWVVLYGGANWITSQHESRYFIHFPFELHIPFLPNAAAIYLSLIPLMILSLYYFRSPAAFLPLFLTGMFEMLVAAPVFIAAPVQLAFPPNPLSDDGEVLFRFADALNLENNSLPSLHVCFAFTLAAAISTRVSRAAAVSLYAWAVLIALSTLLTHQHHVLDVVAGMGLAFFGIRFVYLKFDTKHREKHRGLSYANVTND